MNSESSIYVVVADGFTDALNAVQESQWENRTPCDEWSAADLVQHVITTHRNVYLMADPEGIRDLDTDAHFSDQWRVVSTALKGALDDPALANTPVTTRGGEQPFTALIESLLMIDTLCHTWDLARAVHANEMLDASAVELAHTKLTAMGGAIRIPGGFKDAIAPGPGANEQTKFLNFAGRAV